MVDVRIANGSRAIYDMGGHVTPEQQGRGFGHYMILELIFLNGN